MERGFVAIRSDFRVVIIAIKQHKQRTQPLRAREAQPTQPK